MVDYVIAAVVVLAVVLAAIYIWRAKKRGQKCIGCPDSCSCCKKPREKDCTCGGNAKK